MDTVVRCSFTLANRLGELESLRERLERFADEAGLGPRGLFEINLVLDELVTNIISYGYPSEETHFIDLSLSVEGDELTAVIEDAGIPFDPLSAKSPDIDAPIEERGVGGLGIHLARNMVREMHYERRDGRNVLTLKKRVDRARGV
ncbi:putative anti-sigma regulatory factor, serine/threonine protein kinase [Alkalidesulfovibrio alkalitolerans DSM 16529]|jgi:anti-sigma regulatory factor (Ser/Thr protein kinase)|uniref:Putative anti-sigma regulatory factor, serine/threonine protein kinase n=1 Tax=Alkalidesulfovibrio alkalitolerans DSM 16529 TaxID=1121439 RepID=S7T397_9BACT|nr:ATP-binding protein [Alkalidesulfovibrio alkalitolerans]EPR30975.1 putative anti-sigma regulatory factor, serine/threonine protein kinase [Alkalidesulfovibrio alkalitolerans DSM 16529]